MFCIRISDIVIAVENRYPYLLDFCREFIIPDCAADLTVSVTDEEIKREKEALTNSSLGYCESLAVYRKICRKLLSFDAFLMHAAVIAMDGNAYAFTAISGTGKTTHIRLWQQRFGDRVEVVNGDKPIIRKMDGRFYACGTPWRGKESMGGNLCYPLRAICFVERGKENRIRRMTQHEVIGRIFQQLLMPQEESEIDPYMDLIDKMLQSVEYYLLQCTPENEAAKVAYEGMVEGKC